MPKYRKKPIVIEAQQWWPGLFVQGVMFDEDDSSRWPTAHIMTLEGRMQVSPCDFIITGVQGEKYPCKPDIFRASYEEVPDDRQRRCEGCYELFVSENRGGKYQRYCSTKCWDKYKKRRVSAKKQVQI